MLVKCEECFLIINNLEVKNHYRFVHNKFHVTFMCPQDGCTRSYNSFNSFQKHCNSHEKVSNNVVDKCSDDIETLYSNYVECESECRETKSDEPSQSIIEINDLLKDDFTPIDKTNNIVSGNVSIIDDSVIDSKEDLKNVALKLVSTYAGDWSLARNKVQNIVFKFHDLLNSIYMNELKDLCIEKADPNAKSDIEDKFYNLQSMFNSLLTEHMLFKAFESKGYFIKPETIILGYTENMYKNIMQNIKITGEFVSLRQVFKIFFEIPHVFDKTMEYMCELEDESDGFIENIIQSSYWRKKVMHSTSKIILPIFVYEDDLEPLNPLGSKAVIYKLNGIYVSIPCLPIEYVSKLDNIFLLQLMYADDRKVLTNEVVYKRIIEELTFLEITGVNITINEKHITIYFKLAMMIGDNLGLNSALGFTISFRSDYYCRFCKMKRCDAERCFHEIQTLLRTIENYKDDVLINDIRLTGIKEESVWNSLTDFHVTENKCVDVLHDLLEGVCNFTMSNILYTFIVTKKYFSLDLLNSKLKYYAYSENCNRPPKIDMHRLKYKCLKMSAAEMMCFVLNAGLIFGDLVPIDADEWSLYILLRQILSISLQSFISNDTCDLLQTLVEEHHTLYCKLFNESLKPKHHFLCHYAAIMKAVGPLRHLWTMRFEAKHKPLKQCAGITLNRINICKTVATKHQLHLNDVLLNENVFNDDILCTDEQGNDKIRSMKETQCIHFPDEHYIHVRSIKINNYMYKSGTYVLLKYDEDDGLPIYGLIKSIYRSNTESIKKEEIYFYIQVCDTYGQNEHLQAFEITETETFEISNLKDLIYKQPRHMVYFSDGKKYIANDFFLIVFHITLILS